MLPPRVATWLLMTLGSGPDVDVIAGDLLEQCAHRSRSWYWRQVGHAIVSGAIQELRGHWLLAARAVAIGAVVMGLSSALMGSVGYWLLPRMLPAPINPSSVPVWVMLLGVPASIAAWVIARLHRSSAVPFAMVFAIALMQYELLPRLVFLIRNSLEHERFRPYLWSYLSNAPFVIAIIGMGVLAGTVAALSSKPRVHR